LHTERVQDGRERFIYTTGAYAVKASQENEKLIAKLSEVLNAPVDKLVPTAERVIEEWKNARKERERLIEELAVKESGQTEAMEAVQIGKVRFVTKEFEPLNVEQMIKTASELVKKDTNAVFFLIGKDEKTARFVIMAGKEALEKGVNTADIARAAAPILGGGGSGRPEFAQGGGTKTDKIGEAIKAVEQTIRKQVE
jgi:alanyl-tRNA synthetase